jgi:hypothetical protein
LCLAGALYPVLKLIFIIFILASIIWFILKAGGYFHAIFRKMF